MKMSAVRQWILPLMAVPALSLAACGSSSGAAVPNSGGTAVADASSGRPSPSPSACAVGSSTEKKTLPLAGSQVIRRFVRAFNAGALERARAYLAPDEADGLIAGLAQVRRLRIVDLEDRY
jgi:hypothetical protein